MIVFGLYSVLWGKHKESLENKLSGSDDNEIPEVIKASSNSQPNTNNNNTNNTIFISMPTPENPIKPNQMP